MPPQDLGAREVEPEALPLVELEARMAAAKRAALAFVRAFGLHRFYAAATHEGARRAVDELVEAIQRYLDAYGSLALSVDDTEVRWRDRRLHLHGERETSVAYRLFREGIRDLTFRPGLARAELEELIEVLRATVDGVGLAGEDLVTELWKRDFEHIAHRTVEAIPDEAWTDLDRLTEAEAGAIEAALRGEPSDAYRLLALDAEPDDLADAIPAVSRSNGGRHRLGLAFVDADDPTLFTDYRDRPDGAALKALSGPEQMGDLGELPLELERDCWERRSTPFTRVTPEEEAAIQTEAAHYTPPLLFSMVGEVIFESLTLAPELVHEVDLAQFFTHLVDAHMAAGSFAGSCHALSQIRARVGEAGGIARRVYDEILANLGTWEHVELTVRRISRCIEEQRAAILRYLRLLAPGALAHVAEMVRDVPRGTLRELLLAALGERLASSPELLGTLALSDQEDLVVLALEHLAESRAAVGEVYLLRTIEHASTRVRTRTLQALERLEGLGPLQIARDCLADPEVEVRLAATRLLASAHDPLARESLERRIRSRGFAELGIAEKAALFQALAQTGREHALPFLERLGERRRIFPSEELRELRRLSAYALADIPHPRSRELLEQGARSRDPGLRSICRRMLARDHGVT